MALSGILGADIPGPGLSTYFDSRDYSDITIRCKGETIKAHKVVLAQASYYFKNAFDSSFRFKVIMDLDKFESAAVKGVIAHLYGLATDGKGKVLPFATTYEAGRDKDGANYAMYQVDLFVVACEYMVGSLTTNIVKTFPGLLKTITHFTVYPDHLDTIARHVYTQKCEAVAALRKPVVNTFVQRMGGIKKAQKFKRLLLDIPELAFDLVQALDAGEKEPTTSGAQIEPISLVSPPRTLFGTLTGTLPQPRKKLSRGMLASTSERSPKRIRISSPTMSDYEKDSMPPRSGQETPSWEL